MTCKAHQLHILQGEILIHLPIACLKVFKRSPKVFHEVCVHHCCTVTFFKSSSLALGFLAELGDYDVLLVNLLARCKTGNSLLTSKNSPFL
jgi:hypothetical protein